MARTAFLENATRRAALAAALGAAILLSAGGCVAGLGAPVTVWVTEGQRAVEPRSAPRRESDIFSAAQRVVRLTAVANETVDAQIVLSTTAWAAGPFNVQVGGFGGPEALPESTPQAALFRAEWQNVEGSASWRAGHDPAGSGGERVADVLIPWSAPRGGPVRVRADECAIVWLDVHVPAATPAGVYRSALTVTEGPVSRARYTIELRVLPATLAPQPALPLIARLDPRELLAAQLSWPVASAEETRLLRSNPSHAAAIALVDQSMALLQAHRLAPVLWASFPKFGVPRPGEAEVDWPAYDDLVDPWLSGRAFADGVGLPHWPLPFSMDYPSAERNGGLSSPAYAAQLGACMAAAERHFGERGWQAAPFARLQPPAPLSASSVSQAARLMEIVASSGVAAPAFAFLPQRSPRGLGWVGAPDIALPGAPRWCSPAMLLEPPQPGAWLLPDRPPYCGSLARGAPATDPIALAWLAARYQLDGVWIEHAADRGANPRDAGDVTPLLLPGRPFRVDGPVSTMRLKRLRRGIQDLDLMAALRRSGKPLVADYAAERVIRWGLAEAAIEHLLSTRPAGWPRESEVFERAREALRLELAGDAGGPEAQTLWRRLAAAQDRLDIVPRGMRLAAAEGAWTAVASIGVLNRTTAPAQVRPAPLSLPPGWSVTRTPSLTVGPGEFGVGELELQIERVACEQLGATPIEWTLAGGPASTLPGPARLAAVACRSVVSPPRIDGDISDWQVRSDNVCGDFRLVQARAGRDAGADRPAAATRALVARNATHLFVAVICAQPDGQRPLWSGANTIAIDGAMPWGEDVIELLLDPVPGGAGSPDDLFVLQVKPNGLVVARQGPLTDPPTNRSQPWNAGVEAAARVRADVWIAELAIPLASLGEAADRARVWGFNVTRLDARRGEYASWSATTGHCYGPERLGNLLLVSDAP